MLFDSFPVAGIIVESNEIVEIKPRFKHRPIKINREANRQRETQDAAPTPMKASGKNRKTARSQHAFIVNDGFGLKREVVCRERTVKATVHFVRCGPVQARVDPVALAKMRQLSV